MKRKNTATNAVVQRPSLRRATRSNPSASVDPKEKVLVTSTSHSMTVGHHVKPRSNLKVVSEIVIIDDENPETNVSPIKKPNQKAERKAKHEISPQVSIDVTTPKGKYIGLHQSRDRTTFQDDLLTCSQTDSQSDVNWDCTSPDALRFLKKGRRRRHESDVSDIVNQLLVPEEEEVQEHAKTASTPPLLGLWMNGSSRADVQLKRTDLIGKSNRLKRKERCQSSRGKGSSMPQDLVEKLKQAVNKYDDIQEEAEFCEDRKPVISAYLEKPTTSQIFDQSKDLFENSQTSATASQSPKKEISLQQGNVKPLDIETEKDANSSDISWSDDDIFNDESFLIKATQGTGSKTPVNANRGCKRKSKDYNSNEPLKKTGKLNLKQSTPVQQTKTQVLSKHPPARQEKIGLGGASEKQKPGTIGSEKSAYNRCATTVQKNLGASSTYPDTLITGSQTKSFSQIDTFKKTEKHSLLPSYNVGISTKLERPSNCISNIKGSENIQHQGNTGCDKMTYASGKGSMSHRAKTFLDTGSVATSQVKTCEDTKNIIPPSNNSGSNIQQPVSVGSVSCLNSKTGKYIPSVPNSKTTDSDTMDRNYSKQNPAQQSASCHSNHLNSNKASITSIQDSKKVVTSTSKSPDICKQVYNVDCSANSNRTLEAPVFSSRRRSSGIFDTSLTEDLLCQLAEPDEILESQVSPRPAMLKAKHLDEGTAAKIVPRKLDQPVNPKISSDIQITDVRKGISSTSVIRTNPVPVKSVSTLNTEKPQLSSWVTGKTLPSQQSKLQAAGVSTQGLKPINSKTHNAPSVAMPGATNSKIHQFKTSSMQGASPDKKAALKNSVSTQSKYTFKSSQRLRTGGSSSTSGKGKAATNSIPKSTAVTGQQTAKTSGKLDDLAENSEDLFASDEEDGLSELHILAMLDTVEMESTQAGDKPCKDKLQTEMDKKSDSLNQNTGNLGKCSSDEIERKRQAALERRQKKNNFSCSQSPIKCSPEKIEKKRQDAIRKRNKSSSSSPYGKISPGKCSPEEIEVKRQRAVEKRKKLNFDGPASCDSCSHVGTHNFESEQRKEVESSSGFSSSSQSGDSCSPFKCTPDEIEKKKQAALQRRQEILKVKGNLNKEFSSTTQKVGSYPRR